jgi:hypothetical protein
MVFTILLLLTGLTISSVAIYYSVMGLTAIFAAAFYPIIVMGVSLEVAKLVAATWLKAYWGRIPLLLKSYMLAAVIVLMMITSMGIFGFLSKAHSDQSLVSGDVTSKIAVYDEKIKTSKENIDANRKALKQLDEAVDQIMGRSNDEKGAEKAVSIRRAQQKERTRLQTEIAAEQKTISQLNEERAPIAAEVRKVEAEVGPIKYIAKLLYSDDPDTNILEKAVTWVIIMIVIVFDPLAVLLLIAAQMNFVWWRQDRTGSKDEVKDTPLTDDREQGDDGLPFTDPTDLDPNLEPCPKCKTPMLIAPGIGQYCPNRACDVIDAPKLYQANTTEFFKELNAQVQLENIQDDQAEIDEANALIADIQAEYEPDDGPLTEDQLAQLRDLVDKDLPQGEIVESSQLFESPVWTNDDSAQEIPNDPEELYETSAKRKWKEENPDINIKDIKHQYEIGAIDHLPWDTVEKLDEELAKDLQEVTQSQSEGDSQKKNYIHSNAPGSTDSKGENSKDVEYVQNQEQGESTIWARIKNRNI